jgi:outer membrane protein assembly factor BamB
VQVPRDIVDAQGNRKAGWVPEDNAVNRIGIPHATMALFAFDAATGKELWSSRKAMDGNTTHFTQPVVALGKLFAVDHAGHVWAFGLKK